MPIGQEWKIMSKIQQLFEELSDPDQRLMLGKLLESVPAKPEPPAN